MKQNPSFEKNKFSRNEDRRDINRIRPHFLDFHKLSMKGPYEYPEHIHHQYEVIRVIQGPYRCCLNGNDLSLDRHTLLIIKPGDTHQDHLCEGQYHYVLHFSLQDDILGEKNIPSLFNEGIAPKDQIISVVPTFTDYFFSELEKELKREDLSSYYLQDSLMESFFWKLLRGIPESLLSDSFRHYSKKQEFRGRLFNIFEQSVRSDVSVDHMAFLMNISRRSLSYYCRLYFDESPARLYRKYVLKKASQMLASDTISIQEISEILGFENPFHLSKLFKQYYGESPSRYRNLCNYHTRKNAGG